MIESQNPDGFEESMAAHRLLGASREALEQGIEKARKEERPVSCSITTLP
jgi:hypothetical protein